MDTATNVVSGDLVGEIVLEGSDVFEPVTCGIASCSKNDQFNKSLGRKIALSRAIEHLDREQRTAIWQAYWKSGARR